MGGAMSLRHRKSYRGGGIDPTEEPHDFLLSKFPNDEDEVQRIHSYFAIAPHRRKMTLMISALLFVIAFAFFEVLSSSRRSISSNSVSRDGRAFSSSLKFPLEQQQQQHSDFDTKEEHEEDGASQGGQKKGGRVAFITFSHVTDDGKRFKSHIMNSLRTWLDDGSSLFVVFVNDAKPKFNELCAREPLCLTRIVPIFVDCPEGYYGESPCCKQDKGLTSFLTMFQHNNKDDDTIEDPVYQHFDWFVYMDDDHYVRLLYLTSYLHSVPYDQVLVWSTFPPVYLGQTGFNHNAEYKCSKADTYRYAWGNPIIYSKAAMKVMTRAFASNGITAQCKEYGVTHDAGNAIVHWMTMLPLLQLPWSSTKPRFQSHYVGVHRVAKDSHYPNFTTVHDYYKDLEYPPPPYELRWHNTTAFKETSTCHTFGTVESWTDGWHTMPLSDCNPMKKTQ